MTIKLKSDPTRIDPLDAVLTIECPDDNTTEEKYLAAGQSLIDSGMVWQLQGAYQRGARDLIENGHCHA